jgi:hypothetical protein
VPEFDNNVSTDIYYTTHVTNARKNRISAKMLRIDKTRSAETSVPKKGTVGTNGLSKKSVVVRNVFCVVLGG